MEEEKKTNEMNHDVYQKNPDSLEEKKPETEAVVEPIEEEKAEEKPEETKEEGLDEVKGEYNAKGAPVNNNPELFRPITYINDGTRTIDDDIERIRKTNLARMSSSKIFDILTLVVMVISFIAVLLVTFFNKEGNKALTYSVVGVAVFLVIGSFVLSNVFNKKRTKVVNEYLDQYEESVYGYALNGIEATNLSYCLNAKINDQDVINAHYFRTINAIQSRAAVTGKRHGLELRGAEVAVSIPTVPYTTCYAKPEDLLNLDGTKFVPETSATMTGTQEFATKDMTLIDLDVAAEAAGTSKNIDRRKKDAYKAAHRNEPNETSTGFFGKYFAYDMKVHSNEALIISFMGDKRYTVLPDYISGYHAIKVPGLRSDIVVYVTDIRASACFFDEASVKELNEIIPDVLSVQSGFVSINSYGTKVGLTLSDEIMSLPLKPLKHCGTFDNFRNALIHIFRFIDNVDEKRMK